MNKKNKPIKPKNRIVKALLIVAGTLSLALGIIGIFLPLLPTTPFLLLAAACYARGSKKFYFWLINNRWFGNYIKNYQEKKGIPKKVKIFTITLLWITILSTIVFFIKIYWVRILLLFIALGVSIHILTIKTYHKEQQQ
ncbi:MAG: YbaN family protein [Thermoplasmatota archaeon]